MGRRRRWKACRGSGDPRPYRWQNERDYIRQSERRPGGHHRNGFRCSSQPTDWRRTPWSGILAMKLLATVQIALSALRVNKMRSALTMLGIIIGVAAVIAMVAVGSGATTRIQEQIQSIGSNVIIVLSGSINSGGIRLGSGASQTLSEDDARAMAAECPAVEAASPTVRGGAQVICGNNNWATSIQGVTPEYLSIRDYSVESGR